MNIFKKLGMGHAIPEPVIKITDPVLFNVCLAATEEDRVKTNVPCYKYLLIDADNKRLIGSDGHLLVVAKALDFSKWPNAKNLLIKPERALPSGASIVKIHLNRNVITGVAADGGDFAIAYATIDTDYPNPQPMLDIISKQQPSAIDRITVNPSYLVKLQNAIGAYFWIPVMTPYNISDGCRIVYDIDIDHPAIKNDYTALMMPIVG